MTGGCGFRVCLFVFSALWRCVCSPCARSKTSDAVDVRAAHAELQPVLIVREWRMNRVRQRRVVSVIGPRPEAVKMAPVLMELARRHEQLESILISTAQHREMLDQILTVFRIQPDIDLNTMLPNRTLFDITQRTLDGMKKLLEEIAPDMLLV